MRINITHFAFPRFLCNHIQPGLPSLSVLWGHGQQPSMGPACGLVSPGMYPASSGDPGECRDEEAVDETQTIESRVRLYLFRLEKIEFGLNG